MFWDVLSDHVHGPSSVAEWEDIRKEFLLRWNFLTVLVCPLNIYCITIYSVKCFAD